MSGIRIDNTGSELAKLMQEYSSEILHEMKAEVKKVAKETVQELKVTSPEGTGSPKGHYKDGWTYKTEVDTGTALAVRIHNKLKPGLTHLLEKGHAKRGGGRTRAFPHIAEAEKKAIQEYESRLKERLTK